VEQKETKTNSHQRARLWRRLLRWLNPSRDGERPRLASIARSLAVAALLGALAGPIISLVIVWLGGGAASPVLPALKLSRFILRACAMGAIFSSSFFLTCGLTAVYVRPLIKDYPRGIARTLFALTMGSGGALGFALAAYASALLLEGSVASSYVSRIIVADALVAALLSLVIGAFQKLRADVRRAEQIINQKALRERSLEALAARAQAHALRSQINPHFLFNTLNTLSALITIDPAAAREMVEHLAEVFRYTLSSSRADLVPLADELALVENYLRLEKARLRDRLSLDLEIPGELNGVVLPGLSLQPIVENAIRHGVARRLRCGALQIKVERRDSVCRITVRNQREPETDAPDLSDRQLFREGHALSNVRERMALIYGDRFTLRIELESDEWVRALLVFPAQALKEDD